LTKLTIGIAEFARTEDEFVGTLKGIKRELADAIRDLGAGLNNPTGRTQQHLNAGSANWCLLGALHNDTCDFPADLWDRRGGIHRSDVEESVKNERCDDKRGEPEHFCLFVEAARRSAA
jgi:hypothetical protein